MLLVKNQKNYTVIISNDYGYSPLISFPFEKPPEPGQICEIIPNLYWLRMKLPMYINHVNVYVFREHNGITVVDTGLNVSSCIVNWEKILKTHFSGLKVTRVIATHHHPDHVGLLGWFFNLHNSEIWMSRTAWLMARMLTLEVQEKVSLQAVNFWKLAGMSKSMIEKKSKQRPINFCDGVAYIPLGFRRVFNGDEIKIGDYSWTVRFGNGHAPNHITLWNTEQKILIAGDQVLPGISSNLSVYPTEPLADPVGEWINTCVQFKKYDAEDYLVLPGHKLPFYGLHERLDQLIANHKGAFKRIRKVLMFGEKSAVQLFKPIFKREISEEEIGLALGEAVGHMNHLCVKGIVKRIIKEDVIHYSLIK